MKFIAGTALSLGMASGLLWAAPELKSLPAQLQPSKNPEIRSETQQAPWLMGSFIELAGQNSDELFKIGLGLYEKERLARSLKDPAYAYDWQHRMAFVSAVSEIFNPELKKRSTDAAKTKALKFIAYVMLKDPALIVRDAAVESVRRVIRMEPGNTKRFQTMLERAFVDGRNSMEGEGLFIRETILTALREASLQPSSVVRKSAVRDKNLQVRSLLDAWSTSAYQKL